MGQIKRTKLFEYTHSKGNIDYYKPNDLFNIYVLAINIDNGDIDYKKVLEYTYHKNLNMYKIEDSKNRFDTFWVSDDHSLIGYNLENGKYEKVSPLKLIENPELYCLVKYEYDKKVKLYISAKEINIEYDPNVKEAADLTVEDYYTFATYDGVFVQDTVAIYGLLSNEAQEEAKRKMMSIQAGAGYLKSTREFSKDFILGLYVMTKDELGVVDK